MRNTTKRRTYGRTNIAQALRAAVGVLNSAIEQGKQYETPEVLATRQVIKDLSRAIESYDVYGMKGKRLRAALEKERERLKELLDEVIGLAITPEEKVMAKHRAPVSPRSTGTSPAVLRAGGLSTPKTTKKPARKEKANKPSKTKAGRDRIGKDKGKRLRPRVSREGTRVSNLADHRQQGKDSHSKGHKGAKGKN
ncbi:MAG: hypothetical protein PHU23_00015 [Dehalococcoidales bacterium]|nr:hypothetical protein [Dehalococcoidales bacterium]